MSRQVALGLLDAIAQADLGRALALADTAGDALELVDEAIAVVGERLRTGQAPREAVAAIRALWELRYRLSVTNVPIATALPVLVAEVAAVMADLERQAHPVRTLGQHDPEVSAEALERLLKGNPFQADRDPDAP